MNEAGAGIHSVRRLATPVIPVRTAEDSKDPKKVKGSPPWMNGDAVTRLARPHTLCFGDLTQNGLLEVEDLLGMLKMFGSRYPSGGCRACPSA